MLTLAELQQLQTAQARLDEVIFDRHQLTRCQTRRQRILGFMVELAELANVERTFKYWSCRHDVNPRRMVEEYADALHFLLSISLDLKINFQTQSASSLMVNPGADLPINLFLRLLTNAEQLHSKDQVKIFWTIMRLFFRLGSALRLQPDMVWSAYWTKHRVNHQRQLSLY